MNLYLYWQFSDPAAPSSSIANSGCPGGKDKSQVAWVTFPVAVDAEEDDPIGELGWRIGCCAKHRKSDLVLCWHENDT